MAEKQEPENNYEDMELVSSESRDMVYGKACTCPNCGAVFNRDKVFCPSCGLSIQQMQQPAQYGGYTAEMGLQRTDRSARIFALLSLILGIAGPLALGIGWLLAIIFGFTALNLMRTRGGFSRDKKLALWGICLGFLWPVAAFLVFSFYSYNIASDRAVARNESAVRSLLTDVAVGQKFVKSGFFIVDEDKNLYADFNDLSAVQHGLVPESFSQNFSGYNVQMRVIPAEGFQVSAHPERYGATGRKSFYIDESGILRGGDVSAERNFQNWTTLPRVRDNPVYDDYDNEIARSLISLSIKLAGEGEFERARQILSEVRTKYYMMPAAAGVSDAMESLTRHMYEDGAIQAYAAAEKLAEDGRLRESLTRLKSIKTNYEQSIIIPQVRAKILQVENEISSILEAEARGIFEKAQEYEKQGEYDKAVIEYKKIVKELDSTSYYDRAAALITTVESTKQEKEAAGLFSKIAELNLEESYSEAITSVDTLINHYAGTDFVKENQSRLNSIRSTAIGEREKLNTINAFQQGNFDAAIQAGESAVSANPALRATIVPILSHSYLKRAEALFVNGAYARAVGYYENWMNISEYRGTPEHRNYIESLYNVSKAFFDESKYPQAKEGLEGMERYFSGRDDFWYMLGSISAYEKDYARAISRFRRSVSINEDNPDAWYKKALCKMVFIQEEEDKLKQHIDQLFKLRRGADLFYEISAMVNALNAKDLEIKHLAASTGGGEAGERRRARLPAERDAFEAETRAKMLSLNETLRQNKNIRDRLLQTANAISDAYNETNSHILKIPSGRRNRIRSNFIGSFRRKRQAFESFRKLERGLNQEMRLEENAILNLEFSLGKFAQDRAFDSELRDMFRLREGITQMGMRQSVEEGREELLKALEIKLPVEEHIASIL